MIKFEISMTKFEIWLLKRIFKKAVRQGYSHEDNITYIYELIKDAVQYEFTEDNRPTRDAFLKELFNKSQKYQDPTPTEFLWNIKNNEKNSTTEERLAAQLLMTMLSRQDYKPSV